MTFMALSPNFVSSEGRGKEKKEKSSPFHAFLAPLIKCTLGSQNFFFFSMLFRLTHLMLYRMSPPGKTLM